MRSRTEATGEAIDTGAERITAKLWDGIDMSSITISDVHSSDLLLAWAMHRGLDQQPLYIAKRGGTDGRASARA